MSAPDLTGWLTVEGARRATGLSAATLKRYAASAQASGHAARLPLRQGATRTTWRLDPEALARWADARRSGRTALGQEAPADVLVRLAQVEDAVGFLERQIEALRRTAVDEVQAARTALLAEKTVSEALRSAQRAQAGAATARSEAQRLQQLASRRARTAVRRDAAAAAALGRAIDARSAQLDQLLVPGSPPSGGS